MEPTIDLQKILLIDDDPMQLRIRETVLRQAGFPVNVATTAESALALLHTEPLASMIGLVITDHFLPGMNGAEFARQLRRFKPYVPVLVLSGLADAEDEYAGLNVAFLQKPCPPPRLIALVRTILRKAA